MDNVLRRLRHHAAMVLGSAAICLLTACPLPAPYDVATSAPVVGHLEWADGTPAPGIPILLVTDRGADKPCEKPALRTTTDSTGRFAVAGMTQHHSVMWVVPNLDVMAPLVSEIVDADQSRSASRQHHAARGLFAVARLALYTGRVCAGKPAR